jgi:hypothetical protein
MRMVIFLVAAVSETVPFSLPQDPSLAEVNVSSKKKRLLQLFGLTLSTNFPFTIDLPPASTPADLGFDLSPLPVLLDSHKARAYESPSQGQDGESLAYLFRGPEYEVLQFPAIADFRLKTELIEAYLPAGAADLAELRFLGPVLSYWLERRGVPTLHASAARLGRGVVAFLSHKEGGKTGLAAAMMQAGFPLFTDDILPIEDRDGMFLARPGYPQMRMWPDEAEHFLGGFEDLPLVHPAVTKRRVAVGVSGFGRFHNAALPLACIYLPERVPEGPIDIHEVSPRDALIELVRHSFLPYLVQAAGFQPRRLDFFARLVMQVPMRRLRYPSGFERLPEVVERILSI